ncbi:MAG: hypothetical protein ACRDG4_05265, partial [Chloroflexota bacterium]
LTLRPVSRLTIALAKWLAVALLTTVLIEVSIVLMNLAGTFNDGTITSVAPNGSTAVRGSVLAPTVIGGLLGSAAYGAVFLLLGRIAPKRGILIGFVYVLGWEGLAAGLSSALATFSVRAYVQGAVDAVLGDSSLASVVASSLGGSTSIIVLIGIAAGGVGIAALSLRRIELP